LASDPRTILRQEILEKERRDQIAASLKMYGIPISDVNFPVGNTKLIHTPTQEYFSFGVSPLSGQTLTQAKYSNIERGGESSFSVHANYEDVLSGFARWCGALQIYIGKVGKYKHAPDPFAASVEAVSTKTLVLAVSSTANRPITVIEMERVVIKIEELRSYITEQRALDAEQLRVLNGGVTYLIEAAHRSGTQDWMNILLSILVGLIANGIFDPSRAEELIRFAFALFSFLTDPALLQ
jgi:hypothetical protein